MRRTFISRALKNMLLPMRCKSIMKKVQDIRHLEMHRAMAFILLLQALNALLRYRLPYVTLMKLVLTLLSTASWAWAMIRPVLIRSLLLRSWVRKLPCRYVIRYRVARKRPIIRINMAPLLILLNRNIFTMRARGVFLLAAARPRTSYKDRLKVFIRNIVLKRVVNSRVLSPRRGNQKLRMMRYLMTLLKLLRKRKRLA